MPGYSEPNGDFNWGADGMTLRDYLAAKAMQGLIVNTTPDLSRGVGATHVSEAAYAMADAMLAARGKS